MSQESNSKVNAFNRESFCQLLGGDPAGIRLLPSLSNAKATELASQLPLEQRTITGRAVARVLHALVKKELTTQEAQAWASFMRRGYLPSKEVPIQPIDLEYEVRLEDVIVEAISRMDELGDLIDGSMDSDEIRSLINALEQ